MSLFFIALLTAAGRSHGIGGAAVLRWFSIIAFTACMGYGAYALYGLYYIPLAAVTFLGLNTGHGRFFAMRGADLNDPNPEWIETNLVLPWYKGNIQTPLYSWVCMGIKGLLIGFPIMPFGLILGLLLPAAYVASWKLFNTSAVAEYWRGYFVGVALCLSQIT